MRSQIWTFALLCLPSFVVLAQCDTESERQKLIEFYTSLNGEEWGTLNCPDATTAEMECALCSLDSCKISVAWDTTQTDFSNWYGISVDQENCIITLDFDGNTSACWNSDDSERGICMRGTLPTTIAFPELECFSMHGNHCIDGTFPDFSGCPRLENILMGEMNLAGHLLLDGLSNLDIQRLNLGNNKFDGAIPADITQLLPEVDFLYLHNNNLEGQIPDLSSLELQDLDIKDNKFTFEDLLPHFNDIGTSISSSFLYSPQQRIYQDTTFLVGLDLPFTIDLEVDDTVQSSTYIWLQDNIGADTTQKNKLHFDSIQSNDEGTYRCEVTNSIVFGLTLESFPITIETCTPSIIIIDTTLCPGEIMELPDGQLVDRDSLIIYRNMAVNGCDSALSINVNYYPESEIGQIDTLICDGESVTLGGTSYTQTGTYSITLVNANRYGCDSSLLLNLIVTEPVGAAATIEEDRIVCTPDNHIISANLPNGTFGRWQIPSGLDTTQITASDIVISNLLSGANSIGWILNKAGCPSYDSAFIELYYEPPILANPDINTVQDAGQERTTIINILDNDTGLVYIPERIVEWFPDPSGEIVHIDAITGDLTYLHPIRYRGIDTFYYQITSSNCPENQDTALVTIEIVGKLRDTDIPPNVITPNGDRMNDVLIIPLLKKNPSGFPNNQLNIYSYENKNLLFERKEYQNDWDGRKNDGTPLPEGAYHMIFDYGNGDQHQETIFIIRSRDQ